MSVHMESQQEQTDRGVSSSSHLKKKKDILMQDIEPYKNKTQYI